ncbi:MAG TPA: head GIN domain-containing protein [Chitinophagaceae bacterium]|nr:head GIN domain-containing protein [Chitinophagaceae bacterium]
MKKFLLVMSVAIAALGVQAQKTINDPNAEVRNVSGFHAIRVSNAIDLYLSQSTTEAVAVSASEEKYRDRIKTTVENGVLRIWFDNDNNWKVWNTDKKRLKAYVSFKTLDKLTASGACDVMVEGVIKTNTLDINLSGASDFKGAVEANVVNIDQSGASDATITGRVNDLKVEVSGASDFTGFDFEAAVCQAQASGASEIKVSVSKELSARATGASRVSYKGEGVVKSVRSSGASSINKRS